MHGYVAWTVVYALGFILVGTYLVLKQRKGEERDRIRRRERMDTMVKYEP